MKNWNKLAFFVFAMYTVGSSIASAETAWSETSRIKYSWLREALDSPSQRPKYQLPEENKSTKAKLNDALKQLCLTESKKFGATLIDLTDLDNPTSASYNGQRAIYAASAPKVAVMYAIFIAEKEGRLKIDSTIRQKLEIMVKKSNNSAPNELLIEIGKSLIGSHKTKSEQYAAGARFLNIASLQGGFYDGNGGIWIGKQYANATAIFRDPVNNLSHSGTSDAFANMFSKICEGKLVSKEASQKMWEIASPPGLNHKFVKGLLERYNCKDVRCLTEKGVEIGRKSGSWRKWHSDNACVKKNGQPAYALSVLCEDEIKKDKNCETDHFPTGMSCKTAIEKIVQIIDKNFPSPYQRPEKVENSSSTGAK